MFEMADVCFFFCKCLYWIFAIKPKFKISIFVTFVLILVCIVYYLDHSIIKLWKFLEMVYEFLYFFLLVLFAGSFLVSTVKKKDVIVNVLNRLL